MAPDAWHCVDRNSQMAEWIFHFPSGCVTWWRCSQSLEPKENASQGDEVLLLSRHLIPAGWYCDLGLIYSSKAGHSRGNNDCQPLEIKRETDRPGETCREWLICFLARMGLILTWWERSHLMKVLSFQGSRGQQAGGTTKHQVKMNTSRGLLSIMGITKSLWTTLGSELWQHGIDLHFISSNRQLLCQIWNHTERPIKIYDKVTGYL